jgi:hypothetical protein
VCQGIRKISDILIKAGQFGICDVKRIITYNQRDRIFNWDRADEAAWSGSFLGVNSRNQREPSECKNLDHDATPGRLFTFLLTLLIKTRSGLGQQDHLSTLLECRLSPNPLTQHMRILDVVQNISQPLGIHHFNPAIIALLNWAENQYLL